MFEGVINSFQFTVTTHQDPVMVMVGIRTQNCAERITGLDDDDCTTIAWALSFY